MTNRFQAYENAIECVRALRGLIAVVRRKNGSLATQIRKAAQSMALNVAEGRGRGGRDRGYHFSVALGSARETLAGLDIAEAFGDLDPQATVRARQLLDRECRLLYGLTRQ